MPRSLGGALGGRRPVWWRRVLLKDVAEVDGERDCGGRRGRRNRVIRLPNAPDGQDHRQGDCPGDQNLVGSDEVSQPFSVPS